jgi:dTDP-4-dehydrorhamnose 3,5-epimerase
LIIHQLPFKDATLIETAPFQDHRGSFARFFCSRELTPVLGSRQVTTVNFSLTNLKGAIRGLHFQFPPFQEMKLVRCIKGRVYDVIIDIRKGSPTFLKWHAEILSPENMLMLCIPEGFAHGFQTLEPESELLYIHTAHYSPDHEGGLYYNDPALLISWPEEITDVSDRDGSHPLIDDSFKGIIL